MFTEGQKLLMTLSAYSGKTGKRQQQVTYIKPGFGASCVVRLEDGRKIMVARSALKEQS